MWKRRRLREFDDERFVRRSRLSRFSENWLAELLDRCIEHLLARLEQRNGTFGSRHRFGEVALSSNEVRQVASHVVEGDHREQVLDTSDRRALSRRAIPC